MIAFGQTSQLNGHPLSRFAGTPAPLGTVHGGVLTG